MENPSSKPISSRTIPFRITLIYVLAGGLWILFSDLILSLLIKDPVTITHVQTFKGWLFIGITAFMLYILIKRNLIKIRKSEEALRESEERFRLLVERVTDYEIFMLDPEGRIVIWNIGAERNKGYRAEEIIGSHHSIFFTEKDKELGIPDMELTTAANKGRFEDEGWRVRKDGSLFWANVVTTALRDKNGDLRGYSKVIRDITDRKKAEETLRESEERYRIIAETASDAIITIDEESRIIFANKAVGKIFGYFPDEIIGQQMTVLMPERLRNIHLSGMKRYKETGERVIKWEALELPGLHRNGQEMPLEISYGEFLKDGRHFFTGIVRDITERKLADKEKEYGNMLERFNQKLEILVAERTMNLMALKLADRVRTPAAVIGLTSKKILAKGDIPETAKESLKSIIDEAGNLDAIVKDFQLLVKSKKAEFSYESINEIVRGALAIVEREVAQKSVELVVKLSDQLLKINAQKDLLLMAIFNILRNAVESTPEGGRITVETSGDSDNVMLSISDTGHGIPKETLDKMFDPLYSTEFYSFGMGLPLIKQVVNEHLGEIKVESDTGKGTIFRILFPVRWK